MDRIKIGIIGTGNTVGIAKAHLAAYKDNSRTEVVALYDIVEGRAAQWAKERSLCEVSICSTLDELFEKVDAVSICTPNHTHIDLVIKSIEAGKHVVCEKPIAISCNEGQKAIGCLKKHPDKIAMIAFNYREIPAIKYIKKLIDEGLMGKVYTCRYELGGNRIADPVGVKLEWRMQIKLSGAGSLADFGCHMLDIVDYLLSDSQGKICEVSAMTGTFIKERQIIGVELKDYVTNDDCAVFNARMESGTLLSFVASRVGIPRQMLEITGEGGMLIFNGDGNRVEMLLKEKNGEYKSSDLEIVDVPAEYKEEYGHSGLINEFISGILEKKVVSRSLERGIYIQHILDNANKSAIEGKNFRL